MERSRLAFGPSGQRLFEERDHFWDVLGDDPPDGVVIHPVIGVGQDVPHADHP